MENKGITIYPELIEDAVLFVIIAVALCLISKTIYDWKEKRRLAKEYALYQQMKAEEGDS